MIRYPVEDLAAVLGIELGTVGGHTPFEWGGEGAYGLTALSLATGYSVSTLKRARWAGGLDEYQADRAAVAAGRHPCEVWPSWCLDGLTPCTGGGADGGHGPVERAGGGGDGGGRRPVVGRGGRLVLAVAA